MQILFLANRPSANSQAATVTEYLDALVDFSGHTVHEVSMMGQFPGRIDLDRFDAVVLHYSLSMGPMIDHYLGPELVEKLAAYKGLKAAFLQDEYRAIQTYWANIRRLGVQLLFSCVPEEEIAKVYPATELPGVTVVNVLTGYVSRHLLEMEVPAVAQRSLDIGYRSRQPQYWIGALGWEKTAIAEGVAERAAAVGLSHDISIKEGDRLYGPAWTEFLLSCRAMLGTESGASIIDFDGQLEARVDKYVADNPGVSFAHVSEKFLGDFEGSLRLHQISPRSFECAALRTPMVLFEGDYSGVLEAGRHYIALKKDFSNFDAVAAQLRDTEGLQQMVERTYAEVALDPRWGYPAFVAKVDAALEAKYAEVGRAAVGNPYTAGEFAGALRRSVSYYVRRKQAIWLQSVLMGTPRFRKMIFGLWFMLPQPVQQLVRPLTRFISR